MLIVQNFCLVLIEVMGRCPASFFVIELWISPIGQLVSQFRLLSAFYKSRCDFIPQVSKYIDDKKGNLYFFRVIFSCTVFSLSLMSLCITVAEIEKT